MNKNDIVKVLVSKRDKHLDLAKKMQETIDLIYELTGEVSHDIPVVRGSIIMNDLPSERKRGQKRHMTRTKLLFNKKYASNVRKSIISIMSGIKQPIAPKEMAKKLKSNGFTLSKKQTANLMYNMYRASIIKHPGRKQYSIK